ncbi:MAG: YqgE/AlgH family protein [Deltaproteobacteria bacterium]|nr:YqgE/AlgH family protein [Deltaproteobacteria bacterium]MBI2211497.1 YqgE/AlgH family protein [Deltaproteobacteria bacterium]MBI2540482.1 YqgE/AlgH family protein [Deltaproteobacteria bacterium]
MKKALRWSLPLALCAALVGLPFPLTAQEGRHLAGRLLVATPELGDPNFSHTVIYMVEHDENGAMGLVVNRPLAKGPIADLLKGLHAESDEAQGEIIIHFGGPVQAGKGFVLHSDDYISDSTIVGSSGIAVTAQVEIVQAIARGKGPKKSIFLLGYAGWAPGQLEAEIAEGGWFSIPLEESLIFEGDPATKWERALARRKIKT